MTDIVDWLMAGDPATAALYMDGGTASVYGPRAWAAFREFAAAAHTVKPVAAASRRVTKP
jgi:hypothetical protein